MGSTLRRYVLRQVWAAFVAGLVVAISVLFIMRIMSLVDLAMARGVPASQVLALSGYILPSFLEIALPMAMLLSVVVAVGRLQADCELLAMRAAGLSFAQLLTPIIAFALLIACASLVLGVYARPWANGRVRRTTYEMARSHLTAALQPGVFNRWFGGVIIYIDRLDPESGLMKRILLSDERNEENSRTIFAAEGRVLTDERAQSAQLKLVKGTILSHLTGRNDYNDKTDFASLELNLELGAAAAGGDASGARDVGAMSLTRLLASRRNRLAEGEPVVEETMEIQRKLVLPAATLLLPLIGVPLAVTRSRAVRSRGLVVSVSIVILYYLMLTGVMTLAREQMLRPGLAMWLPNCALLPSAIYLPLRVSRMQPWPRGLLRRLLDHEARAGR